MSGRPPIGFLVRPIYIMQMGWHRWGHAARRKWAKELITACQETISECERILREEEP